jgi:uncharacterized protein YecE (DUF72 family)
MTPHKQLTISSLPSARVGCSGWQYKHWRGDFYPLGLPQSRWLEYYAERFNTVEINNSFNNDVGGHAPRDAKRLLEALRGQVGHK